MANSKYKDWISANAELAKSVTESTGIFPEIMLAQAIIESAKNGVMPGTLLAKKYNNYFGIKAGPKWKGKTVNIETGEYEDGKLVTDYKSFFRVYGSPVDSFRDYVNFLQANKRYTKALQAKTPEAQAIELQRAGYSTNPEYSKTISAMGNVIRKFLGAVETVAKNNPVPLFVAGAFLLYVLNSSNGKQ